MFARKTHIREGNKWWHCTTGVKHLWILWVLKMVKDRKHPLV
jgi:hypothetical protein